jgi:hypothetical protein
LFVFCFSDRVSLIFPGLAKWLRSFIPGEGRQERWVPDQWVRGQPGLHWESLSQTELA